MVADDGNRELKAAKRFDMVRKPIKQKYFLKPLTWLLSYQMF